MLKVGASEKKDEPPKISHHNYQLIFAFCLCKSLTQRRKSGDVFFVCLQRAKLFNRLGYSSRLFDPAIGAVLII